MQRFERRDARAAPNLLVVAVDDKTFADTGYHWPFQRRRHAQAIDRLRRDGARVIVYDVQFTEQTTARDDNALITAVDKAQQRRAGHGRDRRARRHATCSAATRSCTSIGAEAAASNLPEGRGGRAAARRVRARRPADAGHGRRPARRAARPRPRRSRRTAPGSTSTARRGRSTPSRSPTCSPGKVDPARVRGRIVVVGAASPTLQDVHPTPTSDTLDVGARDRGQRDRHRPARHAAARDPALGRPADRPGARLPARAGEPAPAPAGGRGGGAGDRLRLPASSPSAPSTTGASCPWPCRSSRSRWGR